MSLRLNTALLRAADRLANRLDQLERQLDAGDESAWPDYRETARALAEMVGHLAPERGGPLLTTAEMAARLNVSPKTLLKRKADGDVRPAVQRGKLIRWRGDELPT